MESENPFKKQPAAVPTEPAAPQQNEPTPEPAPAPTPEPVVVDPVKEKWGIALDELEPVINRAQQYSWVEEDTFAKTVLSKYREGVPLDEIVKVIGKDWSKATDLDVIREDLARQGITEQDLQDYQIAKTYGEYGEDDDSPEAKLAKKAIAKKSSEIRGQLIEEQKKFGSPTNHAEKEMQALQAQLQAWHQAIENDPITKAVKETNRLTLTYDGREQNLEVQSGEVVEIAKNPGKLIERFGEMNLSQQYQLAAFLSNPEQFVAQVAELGKIAAKEALLKEERNPVAPPTPDPSAKPRITDKPVSEMTTEEKMELIKNATWKR